MLREDGLNFADEILPGGRGRPEVGGIRWPGDGGLD